MFAIDAKRSFLLRDWSMMMGMTVVMDVPSCLLWDIDCKLAVTVVMEV